LLDLQRSPGIVNLNKPSKICIELLEALTMRIVVALGSSLGLDQRPARRPTMRRDYIDDRTGGGPLILIRPHCHYDDGFQPLPQFNDQGFVRDFIN
jgi:hypothetical protein